MTEIFDEIGIIAANARREIEAGRPEALGPLMTRNHTLLQALDVSSPELDKFVEQAIAAGAAGAKLSGAGRGGNMLALVDEATSAPVREALLAAGAWQVIGTKVG